MYICAVIIEFYYQYDWKVDSTNKFLNRYIKQEILQIILCNLTY